MRWVAFVGTLLFAGPLWAADPAEAAGRAGDWEKAAELYLKAYVAGRPATTLQPPLRDALRRAAQLRRHRDPAAVQFAVALPAGDALSLFAEAVTTLGKHAVEPEKATPAALFPAAVEELHRAFGLKEFRAAFAPTASDAAVQNFRDRLRHEWLMQTPATARDARQLVKDIAAAARDDLRITSPAAVAVECLHGVCAGIDEFTLYLAPGTAADTELLAHGIVLKRDNGKLVVAGVLSDSWATANTKLKPGDRIQRVNGRGPEALGAQVRNSDLVEIEFAAAGTLSLPCPAPTVIKTDLRADGVGYIKLAGLRGTTPTELDSVVARMQNQGLRSLILDLRGNPGGSFPAGPQLAERFIPNGVLATTQGPDAAFAGRVFSSASGMSALDVPLVLLIDSRTMSSAEVLAGALKDHGRATLVGMPTFGKGLIQYPFPVGSADGKPGLLLVSVAKAFTPRGTAIHGLGVTPDLIESDPARQLAAAYEAATR